MGIVRSLTALNGVAFLGSGAWAFLAPRSFYETVALFPPYSEHFLHDIGALMIGVAAVLFLALARSDALLVALGGAGIGTAVHAVAHFMDADLGGQPWQPWLVTLQAISLLAAAAIRARAVPEQRGRSVIPR